MPVQELPENEAKSYEELVCPDCLSRSVGELEKLSSQYESDAKKLIYAAKCQNGDCDTDQVPPQVTKSQVESEATVQDYIQNWSQISKGIQAHSTGILTLVTLLSLFSLLAVGLPLSGTDTLSSATGTTTQEFTHKPLEPKQPPASQRVRTAEGWAIINAGPVYVVAGEINRETSYLAANGTIVDAPQPVANKTLADQAIVKWFAVSSEKRTQQSVYPATSGSSNWTMYRTEGRYIVSGSRNGRIVYLDRNGTVKNKPDGFENREAALAAVSVAPTQSFTTPSQSRLRTDVATQEYSENCTIWTYEHWRLDAVEGKYRLVSAQNGSASYLDSNGRIAANRTTLQSYEQARSAIRAWQNQNAASNKTTVSSQDAAQMPFCASLS